MNYCNFYTSKEISPKGWLKRQLEIQAQGLCGNLDKVWRDVKDSRWIGGDAEGWERVPYWLDGFIPLSYLLENDDMISRGKKYIDAIISSQQADGWLCPCDESERKTYDTWALLLITKVLTVYHDCSGDERIPNVIYKALKNYYYLLESGEIRLFGWAKFRWYEGLIAISFTYERFREDWLLRLAKILKEQGADYSEFSDKWKRPLNKWTFETHIVNIAMFLKADALYSRLTGTPLSDKTENLHAILDEYNSTPVGTFTGDECLSGLSPIQGTELCAVAEQMYSYEHLYSCTGNPFWAQRLELLAFNALPAALSDDTWTHQYVQMSNQIACVRFPGKSVFRTNNSEAHLFGLEPNFGCCTANFGQAWPKFTLSAFMHDDESVINVLPVPAELNCERCRIVLSTDYPFRNKLCYTIEAHKAFTFKVRIPSFAENIKINGKEEQAHEFKIRLSEGEKTSLSIEFEATPHFERRPYELSTVKCGSLIFSLPIKYERKMNEYERDGVVRKFPYCDYELLPQSDWNYAYAEGTLTLVQNPVGDVPFSSSDPPVEIKARVKKIDWGLEDGYETVCSKIPMSRVPVSGVSEVSLHPYGCAKLRMTEMPLLK